MHHLLYHITRLLVRHYASERRLERMMRVHEQHLLESVRQMLDEYYGQVERNLAEGKQEEGCYERLREHYLMQFAYEGRRERLAELLRMLEKYCADEKTADGKQYLFDLEHYSKVRIFAVWKEIGFCLDLKQKTLANYIVDETNLGTNYHTIRQYL